MGHPSFVWEGDGERRTKFYFFSSFPALPSWGFRDGHDQGEQLRKVDQEERPRVPDRVREDGGRTANLRR